MVDITFSIRVKSLARMGQRQRGELRTKPSPSMRAMPRSGTTIIMGEKYNGSHSNFYFFLLIDILLIGEIPTLVEYTIKSLLNDIFQIKEYLFGGAPLIRSTAHQT